MESQPHKDSCSNPEIANREFGRNRQAKRVTRNIVNRARSYERREDENLPMPLRRAHSVRRDDVSRREKVEETPPDRSPWTKRRQWTQPGKINNSYWEQRLQSEQSLPPRTPPPRRKILDMMGGRITPQNR